MTRGRRAAGYGIVVGTVFGIGLVLTFVLGRSYSELALQKESFERLEYTPSFDPIEDATLGLSPNAGNVVAGTPQSSIRAIQIYPTQTIMLTGGRAVRSIDQPAPATLSQLVSKVNDPTWLSQSGSVVTMNTAVILEHSSMRVSAPATTEVVMNVRPGVFLAADQSSKLELSGVYFHASDTKTPNTILTPDQTQGRPFILAVAGSTMNVAHSTFRYLGRDWNTSYGLSWSKGSIGTVTNSLFEHNFIGVYSNGSPSLHVEHSQFYYNSLYGVDPHSGSSHQVVEYNTANYNGRHGIIFANHVTGGAVSHNIVKGNGLNGIMMDEASTGNMIDHNTVEKNRSDGVVLANSSDNTVLRNQISGNRVGVTVRGTTRNSVFLHNTVSNNRKAAQGADMSHNTLSSNGGEWQPRRIGVIWLVTSTLLAVLLLVTWLFDIRSRRRRSRGNGRPQASLLQPNSVSV